MEKCPGCEVELDEDDLLEQSKHMQQFHPDIIEERRTEAARWGGWEND